MHAWSTVPPLAVQTSASDVEPHWHGMLPIFRGDDEVLTGLHSTAAHSPTPFSTVQECGASPPLLIGHILSPHTQGPMTALPSFRHCMGMHSAPSVRLKLHVIGASVKAGLGQRDVPHWHGVLVTPVEPSVCLHFS